MRGGIRYKSAITGILLVLVELAASAAAGPADASRAGSLPDLDAAGRHWRSRDLRLTAGTVVSHKAAPGQHLLLCPEGLSLTVAGRQFTSSRGLLWIASLPAGPDGRPSAGYAIQAYLAGRVAGRNVGGGQDVELMETVLERDRAVVIRTRVGGEVFVTAEKNDTGNPRTLPLYGEAIAAFTKAGADLPPAPEPPVRPVAARTGAGEPNRPAGGYVVSFAPLTEVAPQFERSILADGREVITVIGRMYLWWEQPAQRKGVPAGLMEIEADSVVAWRGTTPATEASPGQLGQISDLYVTGDVVLRQGQRTLYADDLYFDLRQTRGLARNVVLRTFDAARNVPIYVRARELRQVAENEYEGDDVVLTTSEFWTPQASLAAARIRVLDRTQEPDDGFEVSVQDVQFRYGNVTLLRLPTVRSRGDRPELPLRSIRTGYDRTFGASLETRWYLSRILGLREPAGTDSTLSLDYYSDRGPGGGVEINYEREDFFGSFLGYALHDGGQDRLSRLRRDIEVPDDLRGRVRLQHRHYLPHHWQLTAEASYLSDRNFLEQFYREESNVGKEQETLLYLKRIQDNWGLAFLGKVRTNDFLDQVEELPSAEYHLTGQSLFHDRFTFFSDSQVSRYRYRFSPENPVRTPDEAFLFTGTRNELDLPLTVGRSKIVPFVAGTFGYDDGAGFSARLDNEPAASEAAVWIGEAGVRMALPPYWCVYPDVQSRLWDLHQLRHIIAPTVTAVAYAASDVVADQRDTLDVGIAQRWQTKRGPAENRRTVDWIEWNTDFVWVSDSDPARAGPDRILWNQPFIPLANRSGRLVPPLDRRATDLFGPRQHYAGTEAILRLTDTTSILGDAYVGMQTGTLEQANAGFSRSVWPDLSYYVGLRYLRRFGFGDEVRSSNALTFALTYVLDPRYTLVFSNQYDFGADVNIATELTLIRRYHRMNLALTFSIDESMDEQRVVLGLWPEGVPELALGLRRYMGLGASDVYH